MSDSKVSMKLLIDTQGKRVLFAEAGKDCVDFLFHILSLPVATIIGMVGSLPNLYKPSTKPTFFPTRKRTPI
ncbi:hypothetical protein SASPL_122536 [Salvia splendens]|uniref:Uncharacterized protein n=1 Tax=Salvia splendens TaxID=180675 RepID=A0A8X8XMB1_SALSN|nr:hypothetical protein SASPL_122536 [Salvia splendens]